MEQDTVISYHEDWDGYVASEITCGRCKQSRWKYSCECGRRFVYRKVRANWHAECDFCERAFYNSGDGPTYLMEVTYCGPGHPDVRKE